MKKSFCKCNPIKWFKSITSIAALPAALLALMVSTFSGLFATFKEATGIAQPPKKEFVMRKSTVITIVIVLAAIAGALAAAYLYLARRERELNEYEELLFSEDMNDIGDLSEMTELDSEDGDFEPITE